MSNLKHWYYVYGTYENSIENSLHKTEGSFSLESNKINKSSLELIKNDLKNMALADYPGITINNFQLISISYLGEMTPEEFNS
ncbi:hypothetical protein [Acinetobacter nosocomialis]|uniref:hypothetical protein n=1 Tax=Acinetobacter nosocomialis TaxID=106654 RepID=UPI0029D42082|nr:hypothetical protein [Acinetobacter nosocomialis]MDX7880462.1 hypothetical protein [Acinetobacter nosocomialis]